jgi:hypothetical protein
MKASALWVRTFRDGRLTNTRDAISIEAMSNEPKKKGRISCHKPQGGGAPYQYCYILISFKVL